MDIIRTPVPVLGCPEDDMALVAIGDVHGHFGMLQKIIATAKKTLPKSAKEIVFVLLGDLIDRGDAAIEIIDLIREGIEDWRVIPILGNHEQLLLRVLHAPDDDYRHHWALWRGNGGQNTLENLQIKLPPLADTDVPDHRRAFEKALGQDRIAFLNAMPSHYKSGNILCVHAGVDPTLSLEENFAKDKLSNAPDHWAWIREGFLDHDGTYPDNCFIVHGHTVLPGPTLAPHRIGLDTGACVFGVLSGATFFKGEMTVFQVTAD